MVPQGFRCTARQSCRALPPILTLAHKCPPPHKGTSQQRGVPGYRQSGADCLRQHRARLEVQTTSLSSPAALQRFPPTSARRPPRQRAKLAQPRVGLSAGFCTCSTIRALLSRMPAHGPTGFQMHCQAELPRTATYFDTRTQVPTTPQGREPAAQRSWIPAERSGLPATASRTLGGADQFTFHPCCAAAFPSNECPQAAAPARQTRAASRRAFSRAQHLLYNSCTSVTDACPWPHRVSDALPGRAAAHCHLF